VYGEFLHGRVWVLRGGREFFERRGREGYAESAEGGEKEYKKNKKNKEKLKFE
jgi:hypothetical protein